MLLWPHCSPDDSSLHFASGLWLHHRNYTVAQCQSYLYSTNAVIALHCSTKQSLQILSCVVRDSRPDHPCKPCPKTKLAQGNFSVYGLQWCSDCLQELRAQFCRTQASLQAIASPPSGPSPTASTGPASAADYESRSQKCKSDAVEIDVEDPDYEWCPSGQLLQQPCSAELHRFCCCWVLTMQHQCQLAYLFISHVDSFQCLPFQKLVMHVPAGHTDILFHRLAPLWQKRKAAFSDCAQAALPEMLANPGSGFL